MIDKIQSLIIRNLKNTASINSLVEHRIYPQHLSTRRLVHKISEDDFPCITIHQDGSEKFHQDSKSGDYYFLVNVWSNTNQEACNDIYEALFSATQHQSWQDSNLSNLTIYEVADYGMLSDKADSGIRHWITIRWKVVSTFK